MKNGYYFYSMIAMKLSKKLLQMTTKTGFTFNPNAAFRSPLIKKIVNNSGATEMQSLKFISVSEPYEHDFRELKCDFTVEDEFGEMHEICDDYIWQ